MCTEIPVIIIGIDTSLSCFNVLIEVETSLSCFNVLFEIETRLSCFASMFYYFSGFILCVLIFVHKTVKKSHKTLKKRDVYLRLQLVNCQVG